MVVDRSDGSRLVPERLVRLAAQVEVEPAELLVVTSNDEVVSERVDVDRRQPLETRLERLDERLANKVVQSDVSLRDDEEVRFGRVEGDLLDGSLGLLERRLRLVLRQLVDENRLVGG